MKTKIKFHHQPGEHIWEGLKEYVLTADEIFEWHEDGIEGKINVLHHLSKGKYLVVSELSAEQTNIQPFNNYIENLKKSGLDVGKGDAEYGFRMPLPEKHDNDRRLIIFRRK